MPTYRMTIRNARPGVLLRRDGVLVFKTEYSKGNEVTPGQSAPDPECYCLESGETYCGDLDADCLEVTGECVDAARAAWEA
jgi:hypothetical protein